MGFDQVCEDGLPKGDEETSRVHEEVGTSKVPTYQTREIGCHCVCWMPLSTRLHQLSCAFPLQASSEVLSRRALKSPLGPLRSSSMF